MAIGDVTINVSYLTKQKEYIDSIESALAAERTKVKRLREALGHAVAALSLYADNANGQPLGTLFNNAPGIAGRSRAMLREALSATADEPKEADPESQEAS